MKNKINQSFLSLYKYCENEKFQGWDPYDGLNSSLLQVLPIKYARVMRLLWIQFFKKSPINLRNIALIRKEFNPKALGLFLHSLSILSKNKRILNELNWQYEIVSEKILFFAAEIFLAKSKGYSGACWGYNFDWQNRVFFQPKYTPTIVVTSFVANALFEAYEVTKNEQYLEEAISSSHFITKDLNRFEDKDGIIFSYSPKDTSKVYNASLLGARLLARTYSYNGDINLMQLSKAAVNYVAKKQNPDGSWIYGEDKVQNWIDSFHTGYNLECIFDYSLYTCDETYSNVFNKGLEYYISNFIMQNGTPKYFHNKTYPIDIHSPAQFITTLVKTRQYKKHSDSVNKVLEWTIDNMQKDEGYFIYQINKQFTSSIPYMRWAQAWMFYAFSNYYVGFFDENLDRFN